MKKYILSIDQGTTSSRVILFDSKFNTIDNVQQELKQYFPHNGWVEHDANEIWKGVKNLLINILKKNSISSSQVLSIGITNQRETTVLWNKKTGKPICLLLFLSNFVYFPCCFLAYLIFLLFPFYFRRSFGSNSDYFL